ncbi:MAG: polysulfide reductase NrfD [Bacteroidales bacterium]|nr:polysulfide reductase NrfD [Bacteroidales bacterium]
MKEELFASGRNIPNIDPYLNVWHWQIPLYLFLGGLAAGILFFAAIFTIMGKDKEMPTVVKKAPIIAPFALILGLIALFLDLKHKLFFWQLYTTFRITSPMSWGAWVLMAITPLSMIWVASYMKELVPGWRWKMNLLENFESFVIKNRIWLAWIIVVLSVILGIYTGILLSAFNARPLWNTSILGPLFLVSGLSTGAATVLLLSKSATERRTMSRIDLLLIVIELFFITHMIMGFQAASQVQIDAAQLFLGGQFTVSFWVFVIFLGLVIPAAMEVLELLDFHIPVAIPVILVLLGGLMFRFIMVEAGQITRYLY